MNGVLGSMTIGNGRCVPIAGGPGNEVDCSKDIGAGCDINPTSSQLTFPKNPPTDVGLVTVSVEGINKQTGGQCGDYAIGADYKAFVAGRP